jgi:murein DD-endopeptidase MepM/ murein hydrolase activator NlpD
VTPEGGKRRPNARWIFVGAVVAVLVLTPLVALASGGGERTEAVRAQASAGTVDASSADVPHKRTKDPSSRPLPKTSRNLVDDAPAGVTGDEAMPAEGVPMDGEAIRPCKGQPGLSPGAACDEDVRRDLKQQRFWETQVRKAPEKFSISFGTGKLAWPLPGYTSISSPFGMRWGRLHAGIDIPAPIGTRIIAADKGTVIVAGPTGGYGNYTCVQHTKSLSTCYGHQSRILVRPGDDVAAGQVIGLSGNTGNSTGPHLHFETRNGGSPFDPMTFF